MTADGATIQPGMNVHAANDHYSGSPPASILFPSYSRGEGAEGGFKLL